MRGINFDVFFANIDEPSEELGAEGKRYGPEGRRPARDTCSQRAGRGLNNKQRGP